MHSTSRSMSSNYYVVLFGAIMLVGLLALAWIGSPPTVTAVGQPLPPLDLQPLIGTDEALSRESLHDKVVVLHFWGTWCPPCVREYPEFAKLARQFADNPDVAIVSVSTSPGPEYDLEELRRKTLDFMTQLDAPLPTYADPAAMTRGKLALLLPEGTFSYPTTLLVDRQGQIVEALVGSLPDDMEKLSGEILARL